MSVSVLARLWVNVCVIVFVFVPVFVSVLVVLALVIDIVIVIVIVIALVMATEIEIEIGARGFVFFPFHLYSNEISCEPAVQLGIKKWLKRMTRVRSKR